MFLRELFDKPANYTWTTQDPNDRYIAQFTIGEHRYTFSAHIMDVEGYYSAEVAFCQWDGKKCRTDVTASGNGHVVFATVAAILAELVRVLPLERVIYSAEGESRVKIYNRLMKRVVPSWTIEDAGFDYFYVTSPTVDKY